MRKSVSGTEIDEEEYSLPDFASLQPRNLQGRVLTRSQWSQLRLGYAEIETARTTFNKAVERRTNRLETDCRKAVEGAREKGMRLAADELLKAHITTVHSARERQGELVNLMFAALETILGSLPPEMVSAQLAETALHQQIDAHSVIAVTVHTDAVESVTKKITAWCHEAAVIRVEVKGDSAMSPTDCDIETSYGTVRAGLHGQLRTMKTNLQQAAELHNHEQS